jgi:hypothetical protein
MQVSEPAARVPGMGIAREVPYVPPQTLFGGTIFMNSRKRLG